MNKVRYFKRKGVDSWAAISGEEALWNYSTDENWEEITQEQFNAEVYPVNETYGWYYAIGVDDFPQYMEHSNSNGYSGPFKTEYDAFVHYMENRANEVKKLEGELSKANGRYDNYVGLVESYYDDDFA